MTTLTAASRQWATRPADQRFTSLDALLEKVSSERRLSKALNVSTRSIEVQPRDGDEIKGIQVRGANGRLATPSNWSFGQLSALAGAPAGYLRSLPAPIAADAINYGLKFNRAAEDIKVLLATDAIEGADVPYDMRAATGPNYGRIWNEDIVRSLVEKFGDGRTGDFRIPGEFGKQVPITEANTTLYASDRDMFVFLADETNRIEISDRRAGQGGSLARGFFIWNSEVGSQSIGFTTFLFDYVCMNRIVWGATQVKEIRLRHTVSAPHRWLDEVAPLLVEYSRESAKPVEETLAAAQARKLDSVEDFLAKRFTKTIARGAMKAHMLEENRPIETMWDAVTGVTAYAKGIAYQDERVAVERGAGKLLDLVKSF